MNPFRNVYLQELTAKQKEIDKNKNNKIDGEDLAHLRKEELKGAQHKIDKNKNGKVDSHDFKLLRKEEEVLEGAVPAHMQGKQKPYVSSDGKGNYEVLGNTGQTKAEFSRKEHGKDAQSKAQAHLKSKYNDYMKEEALDEAKPGLYANINAKRKRIEAGSNERMRKPGSEGAPSAKDFKDAAKTVKEEVLDEANHREFASQGKMHPDMAKHMKTGEHMDYYEPKTGDKVHGKVMKNDGKEVHVKQTHDSYNPKKVGSVHKFTVSSKLDEKKEDPPFDGPYTKVKDTVTDKSGAKHTPMSRAKHLAQQAAIAIAKKKVKEEFDMDITTEQALELLEAVKKQDIPAFLRKARGDKPLNLDDLKKNDSLSDKNNLAKARGVKEELDESVFADKEQATSVADKLKKKHEDGNYSVVADKGKHRVVHAYHSDSRVKKDIAKLNEEQIDELSKGTLGSYVKKAKGSLIGSSQVMGMGSKMTGQKTHDKAEKKVEKRASGINKAVDRLTKEETEMNSFKSYMQEDLDEAMWPGTPEYIKKFGTNRGAVGTSSKTAKGTQTVTKTGVKHERDYESSEKDDKPESGEKRGRGRPKGAASGARQKGSAAKADDRYDSTGFKLHLPNKNR
jgi:hypothetical protein